MVLSGISYSAHRNQMYEPLALCGIGQYSRSSAHKLIAVAAVDSMYAAGSPNMPLSGS